MENQIEKIIEVKNVKKVYRMGSEKIYAVDDVNFEILKGEFCCLLGTSGSGKSTLLNLMAGIEKLSSGQIIIKGKKIHRMNENSLARFRQRYLGFVFQSYNLMNSMTALENVEFPLVFKRVKGKKRKRIAKDMLTKVGLESRISHKPKEMSGGQQQRVGIARAFVSNPEIVFADEPTGNLDTKTAMEVMKLIKGIAKNNKQTIVMVTHDRRLAEFADKIIHILDGKIQDVEIPSRDKQEEFEGMEEKDNTVEPDNSAEIDEIVEGDNTVEPDRIVGIKSSVETDIVADTDNSAESDVEDIISKMKDEIQVMMKEKDEGLQSDQQEESEIAASKTVE